MGDGKKPDFNLSAKPRDGRLGGKVGAGWKNTDGSISIQLNVGVTLSWNDELFIGLFPAGEWRGRSKHRTPHEKSDPADYDERSPDLEDEVPFG